MKEYKVIITETLQKEVYIEADDEQAAINQAQKKYKNIDYILDADDFVDVEFDIEKTKMQMTNYEWIKNMSIEEMSDFLEKYGSDKFHEITDGFQCHKCSQKNVCVQCTKLDTYGVREWLEGELEIKKGEENNAKS